MTDDSEHALLLGHLQRWMAKSGRAADLDLLDELLRLRWTYDELRATDWPAGSVEHLLLERWPSKGAVEPPPPERVTTSLDTWFRFLRGTGRLTSASADPKSLTKEAKRAAPRMAEAAADRSHWSPTKILMDFGESVGIDLQEAPDLETLQARMAEVQDRWNSLTDAERGRLMPFPDGGFGPLGDDVDDELDDDEWDDDWDLDGYGPEATVVRLMTKYADRLPELPLPPVPEVAAELRESAYVRSILALADWLGPEGREVTARGLLRPAVAREAYSALGLEAVHRRLLERRYPNEALGGVRAVGREKWIEGILTKPWRSAGDCEPLARLWEGALAAGLIDAERKVARSLVTPDTTDETWAQQGLMAIVGLVESLGVAQLEPALDAMLHSYVTDRGPTSKEEWLSAAVEARVERLAAYHDDDYTPDREFLRGLEDHYAGRAWGHLADTGLYTETDTELRLTALGEAFVSLWLATLVDDLPDEDLPDEDGPSFDE
ncbi:MAG TPA: hypothetical protein VFL99_07700 [Segeticoccus sp.]|uniref:hypothetical protein n=1 Tax=Segeticoccus sp. TaxID=2706531 RepID=UPI002D7F4290|nr:hypothetical protein [Segeticoccus sp.]HET8600194.1 hypothetical protein [Segeticoccus sp.]